MSIENFGKKGNYVMRCVEGVSSSEVENCAWNFVALYAYTPFSTSLELTPSTHGAAYETHTTKLCTISFLFLFCFKR